MDDLTKEFLLESSDGLDGMERALGGLLNDPSPERIAEIFRAVHTMKSSVGFLGFARLEKLAHAGETLLARIRDGKTAITEDLVGLLTQLADRLRGILQLIELHGHEGQRDVDDDNPMLLAFERVAAGGPVSEPMEHEDLLSEILHGSEKHTQQVETVVRVEVETLNRLMNLVGELVQTRNQFLQAEISEESFAKLGRRLDGVTTNLRESVMQARMQPVGQLFQRFPRLAREVAASCGKRVRMEFHGGETGLDKSLLEALKDPIAHAVRNAIDHGIEAPSVRSVKSKAAEGCVTLRAYHDGGQIVVEVRDDGSGVDCKKVIERGLERGLVTPQRAAGMRDADAMELLFEPGFSTSDEVTTISGRGVGLDVVRANVERIGGSVEMHSAPGEGAMLRMRVPLTLAILPALVAQCGGQKFALPHCSLQELMIVHRTNEAKFIQRVGDSRMVLLRDRLVPLLDLSEMLEMPMDRERGYYVAILEAKGRPFGLVVDDLGEPQEIVVKPLSTALEDVGIYSGATILGDGAIALILDTVGIARRAHLCDAAEGTERFAESVKALAEPLPVEAVGDTVLLFANVANERTALPLRCVERIESLASANVEHVGGIHAMQHRGEMVALEASFDPNALYQEDALVLICTRPDTEKKIGILVREVEVAEGHPINDGSSNNGGFIRANEKLAAMYGGFELATETQLIEKYLQEAA